MMIIGFLIGKNLEMRSGLQAQKPETRKSLIIAEKNLQLAPPG
jgi:hypothetical protein